MRGKGRGLHALRPKGARWLPVAQRGPGLDGPSQPPEGGIIVFAFSAFRPAEGGRPQRPRVAECSRSAAATSPRLHHCAPPTLALAQTAAEEVGHEAQALASEFGVVARALIAQKRVRGVELEPREVCGAGW